jgi:hypothetical protein
MRGRCADPHNVAFHHYGGRGICVCERWHEFEAFRNDMLLNYEPGLVLDRIDNDGNYEPGNCRWATSKVSARNTRRNRFIDTAWGKITVAEAAERAGMPYGRLLARLWRGWPGDRLFVPLVLPSERRRPDGGLHL